MHNLWIKFVQFKTRKKSEKVQTVRTELSINGNTARSQINSNT